MALRSRRELPLDSGPSAMALPPPLDSGREGKQRVGAQSNGGGSSREDIPRRKTQRREARAQ